MTRYSPRFHYTGRLDRDNLIRVLAGEIFYFSTPHDFNDPLDLAPTVTEFGVGETSSTLRVAGDQQVGATGSSFVGKHPGLGAQLSLIYEDLLPEDKGLFRVLCLSEQCDIGLMWAHYANRHRGICVEVDPRRFAENSHKVRYDGTLSLSQIGENQSRDNAVKNLCVKTEDWAYEKEWRIFSRALDESEQRFVQARGAVISVTLGCKVSRADQREIVQIISRVAPRIRVYQSHVVRRDIRRYQVPFASCVKNGLAKHELQLLKLSAGSCYSPWRRNKLRKQFFKAGRVVSNNELKRFVKLTIDYLGAIEQAPHALLFALHPLLPALEIELLPDTLWLAIAAASRRCNSGELKDAVSRWIPSKFLRFLEAYLKVATDTESQVFCVIDNLLFGDSANAANLLVCVDRLLEQGALSDDTRAFIADSLYLRSKAIVSDGAVAPEKYDACSSMLKTSIACRTTLCAQKLLEQIEAKIKQ